MTAAFFDMDETIIGVNSAKLWVRYQWERGEISTTDLMRSMGYLLGYRLAVIDMERVASLAVQRLEGTREDDMRAEALGWYEREVRPHILPRMVDVIEDHRGRGHHLVLLTASSPYVAEPLAAELGIEAIICTRFQVVDGVFTGELDGPLCYGPGKVTRSSSWASGANVRLRESYFYSDSYTDRPMFDAVGRPVAVNPDPRLARHARRVGMPILLARDA